MAGGGEGQGNIDSAYPERIGRARREDLYWPEGGRPLHRRGPCTDLSSRFCRGQLSNEAGRQHQSPCVCDHEAGDCRQVPPHPSANLLLLYVLCLVRISPRPFPSLRPLLWTDVLLLLLSSRPPWLVQLQSLVLHVARSRPRSVPPRPLSSPAPWRGRTGLRPSLRPWQGPALEAAAQGCACRAEQEEEEEEAWATRGRWAGV